MEKAADQKHRDSDECPGGTADEGGKEKEQKKDRESACFFIPAKKKDRERKQEECVCDREAEQKTQNEADGGIGHAGKKEDEPKRKRAFLLLGFRFFRENGRKKIGEYCAGEPQAERIQNRSHLRMNGRRQKRCREGQDPAKSRKIEAENAHTHAFFEGVGAEISLMEAVLEDPEEGGMTLSEPQRIGNIDVCQYEEKEPEKKAYSTTEDRAGELVRFRSGGSGSQVLFLRHDASFPVRSGVPFHL